MTTGSSSAESPRAVLSPVQARRVFLTLTLTRWFPVGLVVSLLILWMLERGLSVSTALLAFSFQGLLIFALELPTSGFADAFGRRPMLVAAAVINIAASAVIVVADSFWAFALAAALQGVFRALDSGPLEAWYVDTVHLTDPDAEVGGTLAAHGTVLGVSIAAGAVLSGALVVADPLPVESALLLPMLLWSALNVVHLGAVLILMREPRLPHDSTIGTRRLHRAAQSAREAPAVVRDGLGLLRSNRVLRGVVLVEFFIALAMTVFEVFQPVRLAELVGGEEQAGAIMGPVAAGGWALFALGSALGGLSGNRFGVTATAIAARVLNGIGAVVMGVVAGPAALIVAYLFTYGIFGAGGPMHAALLHREATARNRATVLSINSMVGFASFSIAAPALGFLAEGVSTQTAMITAGAVSVLGAYFYLPALRAERARRGVAGSGLV